MKKYQLPKGFAEKWVKALRSGKYKQGKEQLCNEDGYCCLGVAAIIAGATPIQLGDKQWLAVNSAVGHAFATEKPFLKNIPEQLKGMNNKDIISGKVAALNDGGKSFAEIADWIESNVEFV